MPASYEVLTLRLSLLFVLLLTLALPRAAVAVEYRGSHTFDYGTFLREAEKQQTELLALQNAVERWVAEKNTSHYKNYERIKSSVDGDIKSYLLDYKSTPALDKKNHTYRVTVLVNINEPKLLSRLIESPGEAAGEKKYITFIFVAREQAAKIKDGARGSSRSSSNTESRGIARNGTDAGGGTAATLEKNETRTLDTTNYQVIRKDQVVWDVSTANEIDVAMGKVFTEADLRVIDAAYLEEETDGMLKVERFVTDYRGGMDLQAATKSAAMKGLRTLENSQKVDYMAIGTLDIDETTIDPTTGNIKIAVSVTGQILSIHERGTVVAKVGPETSFGEGNTALVARNNALTNAAQAAASTLVAQLSAKGIR